MSGERERPEKSSLRLRRKAKDGRQGKHMLTKDKNFKDAAGVWTYSQALKCCQPLMCVTAFQMQNHVRRRLRHRLLRDRARVASLPISSQPCLDNQLLITPSLAAADDDDDDTTDAEKLDMAVAVAPGASVIPVMVDRLNDSFASATPQNRGRQCTYPQESGLRTRFSEQPLVRASTLLFLLPRHRQ